jgi:hypothetical protein
MKKGPKPALTDKSVVAQVTFLSSDDEFTPAALVDDVSGAPSPGGMKQIVSDPFAGEELSPLAPRFAFQTLFEHVGSNQLQFVWSTLFWRSRGGDWASATAAKAVRKRRIRKAFTTPLQKL